MTFNVWVKSDDGKKHVTEYFAERLRATGAVIGSWDDLMAFAEREQSTWPVDRFGYPTGDNGRFLSGSSCPSKSGWTTTGFAIACAGTRGSRVGTSPSSSNSDEGRRLVSRRFADLLLQSGVNFECGWDLDKFAVANPTHFSHVGFPYMDDNGKQRFRQPSSWPTPRRRATCGTDTKAGSTLVSRRTASTSASSTTCSSGDGDDHFKISASGIRTLQNRPPSPPLSR